MNVFDWFKQITLDKKEWNSFTEEEQNEFNPYIINNLLAAEQNYVELVNIINKLYSLKNEQIYNIYKNLIPKKRIYKKYYKTK